MENALRSTAILLRKSASNIAITPKPIEPPPPELDALVTGDDAALETATVVELIAVPPAPVHCKVNVLVAFSDADVSLPLAALFPAHAPVAEQPVALVEDHVIVVA